MLHPTKHRFFLSIPQPAQQLHCTENRHPLGHSVTAAAFTSSIKDNELRAKNI
jgi:hypothetical protein